MPNANRMERFSQDARRVLRLAQEEAERMQHGFIGTEHLLLGLLREEDSVAGRALRNLGLESAHVAEQITQLTQAGTNEPIPEPGLSPGTKKALELAVDEARRMGHHAIGTEHLLLGLVRMNEGVAIDVFKQLNVAPEAVRRQVRLVLQKPPASPGDPGKSAVLANLMARQSGTLSGDVGGVARVMALLTPIFGLAEEEAAKSQQHLNFGYVLLVLMRQDSIAGYVLRDMGLKEAPVEALAKDEFSRNPPVPGITASAQFGNVIDFIVKALWPTQAVLLGSQYLLLGLLHFHEEVFQQLGLNPDEVRARIERLW